MNCICYSNASISFNPISCNIYTFMCMLKVYLTSKIIMTQLKKYWVKGNFEILVKYLKVATSKQSKTHNAENEGQWW